MANLSIIRDLSEKKKITLREIANSVSISEDGLQKIMKSGRTNTDTLERIAKVLNVPVGYFFDDTPLSAINQKGGNGSAMTVIGNATVGDAQKEIEHLKNRLRDKEDIIELFKMQSGKEEKKLTKEEVDVITEKAVEMMFEKMKREGIVGKVYE